MKKGFHILIKSVLLVAFGLVTSISARPYIVGADVSWVLEDESLGANYWDNGVRKDLFQILKEHGVNFIRLRTFVNPCAPGGYAFNNYSGASSSVCWCDLEHTIIHARRIKAAGMGFLLDFHMSDIWASIGEQHVPSAWANDNDEQMRKHAYDYVKLNVKTLIDAGLRPDMIQVGNEINTRMSGVSISNPDRFAALINAGVRAVRELDPSIKIVMQHGRPRPDGDFMGWYNTIKSRVDYDFIGGSTYGTTNNGGDWREMFGNVVRDGTPVMSLEYTANRTALINTVMNEMPNQMGLGTFVWEPTRYDVPMFDRSGQRYTSNAKLDELLSYAQRFNATLPDWVQVGSTQKYTISTTAAPGGSISQSPAGTTLSKGVKVDFTATPLSGWEFSGWTGDYTGTNPIYSIASLASNVTLNASFRFVARDSSLYEGENTKLNSAIVENTHPGFSGTGYANFNNEVGSAVEFSVCVSDSGQKYLAITYANGATSNRPVSISVNGQIVVQSYAFESTGAWETWNTLNTTLNLKKGVNTITMTSTTADGGPNLDKIELRKEGPVAAFKSRAGVDVILYNPYNYTLTAKNPGQEIRVQLHSVNGNVVYSEQWSSGTSHRQFKLPVEKFQRGLYVLKISSDGQKMMPKILVIR